MMEYAQREDADIIVPSQGEGDGYDKSIHEMIKYVDECGGRIERYPNRVLKLNINTLEIT